MLIDLTVNGGLEIDQRVEDAALEPSPGEFGEEALDGVEPRGGCWREMEDEPLVAIDPGPDLGVLVGTIVVDDGMDHVAGRDGALDRIEEADELLVAVALRRASSGGV